MRLLLIDGTVWRQDVASRACTGTCAVWRVPAMSRSLILRQATEFKTEPIPHSRCCFPRYSDWVHSIALYAVVLFLVLRKIYASFDVRDGRPVGFDIRLG